MPQTATKLPTFLETLENTLEHYTDALWLGEQSPFAAPYFLHQRLRSRQSAQSRGEALQELLSELANRLIGAKAEECRKILSLYYFEKLRPKDVRSRMNIQRTKLSDDRREAIRLLAIELIRFANPALRLEEPPPIHALFERETMLEQVSALLQQRQSITLLGAGGIGKSTFAAALVKKFSKQTGAACFWYTIRPDLNDQVESFVFALGLFAHQRGVSTLWQELVATQGKATSESNGEKLLEQLRHLVTTLRPVPMLFIDEVDLLQATPEQASLLRLLESLKGLVPLVLIGQRSAFIADHTVQLSGLSVDGMRSLLALSKISLSQSEQQMLQHLTSGNPRLIQLFCNIVQSGEESNDLLMRFSQMPTLETLLARMLSRLTDCEIELLKALSVFPSPVSSRNWQSTEPTTITSLTRKQLIVEDNLGGIEIPLIYRPLIERNLSKDEYKQFHAHAAHLRGQEAAFTAATYHWIAAENPYRALLEWQEHKLQEIEQGQAATALKLFRRLASTPMPTLLQEQLKLLCGELEAFCGKPQIALEDIRDLLQKSAAVAVAANELAGKIHNENNELENAERAFRRGLHFAEFSMGVREAMLHKGLAWGYWSNYEITQAEKELQLAEYEIENMRGNIARERGQHKHASQHYQHAITIAEKSNYLQGVAKTSNQLAAVLMRQGEFDNCFEMLERAYQIYTAVGKIHSAAGACISKAVAHNLARNHQSALDALFEAEKLLTQSIQPPANIQLPLLQARAEAHLGLGNLDEAKRLAHEVNQLEDIAMSRDAWWVLGEVAAHQEQWQDAEYFLQNSIHHSESDVENLDLYLAAIASRSLAAVYARQKKWEEAYKSKKHALEIFTAIQLPNEIERTQQHINLADIPFPKQELKSKLPSLK